MKKLALIILVLYTSGAFATDYVSDNCFDSSSVCKCDCDCSCDTPRTRDNYTGIRLYKGEHNSYSYHLPNGYKEEYLTDHFGFGTVMGNRLTDFARIEYETLYMGQEYTKHDKDFDYDVWSNFLNIYGFQEFSGSVSPYVGFGLGLTAIWGEMNSESDSAFELSYQLMFGILFELNSRIELDLGAKYVNFGKVQYDNGVGKIDATQIYLGASYKFSIN